MDFQWDFLNNSLTMSDAQRLGLGFSIIMQYVKNRNINPGGDICGSTRNPGISIYKHIMFILFSLLCEWWERFLFGVWRFVWWRFPPLHHVISPSLVCSKDQWGHWITLATPFCLMRNTIGREEWCVLPWEMIYYCTDMVRLKAST